MYSSIVIVELSSFRAGFLSFFVVNPHGTQSSGGIYLAKLLMSETQSSGRFRLAMLPEGSLPLFILRLFSLGGGVGVGWGG